MAAFVSLTRKQFGIEHLPTFPSLLRFADLVRVHSLHIISRNHSNTFLLINMQKTRTCAKQNIGTRAICSDTRILTPNSTVEKTGRETVTKRFTLQANAMKLQAWGLWHRCISLNFVKFLRTPFLYNTYGGYFFNFIFNCKNYLQM